ncbi:hypothetical protein [Paenibacillus pinistramenti]|uniref:hypothetical protein n=1 Tax=Paenibacillus pinistramenti TaxID=1768003 RepID=UPI001EEFBE1D|nr:hypothetical protein [Paenibacillus pinistramenti]
MGEEKPDEDLMGKRKSSPRLSTTFGDVDIFIMSGEWRNIHARPKKGWELCEAFFKWLLIWYDNDINRGYGTACGDRQGREGKCV